jgi:hypothetical protein
MGIDNVKGPSNPADSAKGAGKKDKVKGEEFKEFMKVEDVDETDAEQKRKGKNKAEEVEKLDEETMELMREPAPPKAPFAGPAEVSAREVATPKSTGPTPETHKPISVHATGTPSSVEEPTRAREVEPETVGRTRGPKSTEERAQPEKLEKPSTEPDIIEEKREAGKKGVVFPEQSTPILDEPPIEFEAPPVPNVPETEEQTENLEAANPQTLPLPMEPTLSEVNPIEESEGLVLTPQAPSPTTLPPGVPLTSDAPLPTYTQLPAQILSLYERMVGVITVMQVTPGVTETAIHLNSEQFTSSIFYGAKIIISEDKNARNQFNIIINVSPQAAELLRPNLDQLHRSFTRAGYNFEVKQITINISEESEGEFKRKGAVGDQQQDQGKQ